MDNQPVTFIDKVEGAADTIKIIQVNFFDDIEQDDIKKQSGY